MNRTENEQMKSLQKYVSELQIHLMYSDRDREMDVEIFLGKVTSLEEDRDDSYSQASKQFDKYKINQEAYKIHLRDTTYWLQKKGRGTR